MGNVRWPDGKRFAFTIVDDTDFSTVANAAPVYEFLSDCGLLTTKTVWPLRPKGRCRTAGGTLEEREYREWVVELQKRGVEIALHGVADGSSPRARVEEGLDRFRDVLGADPSIHTNHVAQQEGIYWGAARLDAPLRWLYQGYRMTRAESCYEGASRESAHFWGDLCRRRIKYVRNFVFDDVNTLKMDTMMPYHDPWRPYVRHWFSASNGALPETFCQLLSEANQDRLEAEGGACIIYTHLGQGFHPLPARFRELVQRLSRMAGWYVPATELLDHVGAQRGWCEVGASRAELWKMQWRWAWERSSQRMGRLSGGRAGGAARGIWGLSSPSPK